MRNLEVVATVNGPENAWKIRIIRSRKKGGMECVPCKRLFIASVVTCNELLLINRYFVRVRDMKYTYSLLKCSFAVKFKQVNVTVTYGIAVVLTCGTNRCMTLKSLHSYQLSN